MLCITSVLAVTLLGGYFVTSDRPQDNEVEAALEATPKGLCYGDLGCFNLYYPWVSIERPFPVLPDEPKVIKTTFYLSTRAYKGVKRIKMKVEPTISLNGTDWDPARWTVIITHGFRSDSFCPWVRDLEATLLDIKDINVISCDWKAGASGLNYIKAAVNTRVVGAQVARLIKLLLKHKLASPDRIHLIGQSLGAHALSYVSAKVKKIARLTALDPAQPGFERAHPDTRVDPSDAVFVDVIHTNAAHFITSLGMGMIRSIGHVDFFVNGGKHQPGCWLNRGMLEHMTSYIGSAVEMFQGTLACSHQRASSYYIEALKNNCSFWGKRLTLSEEPQNSNCGPSSCQRMGRHTYLFPARGTFYIWTRDTAPYCIPDPVADYVMTYNQYGQFKDQIELNKFGGI